MRVKDDLGFGLATEGMELLFVDVGEASGRMKSWGKDQEFQAVLMLQEGGPLPGPKKEFWSNT